MDFATVKRHVEGVPFILDEMARDLYSFILKEKPRECLELGFGHGASSCYIAAALDELGAGRLTTVDLLPAKEWQTPSIESLLLQTGLSERVQIRREHTSYNWFLKKQIEKQTVSNQCRPIYDFCFIDGSKHWTVDGAAFFLVDKLLKPGGWIVFDDLMWTFQSKIDEGKRKTDGIFMLNMGPDELAEPHLELVFKFLVVQHPSYSNFMIKDDWWGWAQKVPGSKSITFEYSENYLKKKETFSKENTDV